MSLIRIVSLISIIDGNAYDFKDDLVENTPGGMGEMRPKQCRSIIYACLDKKLADGEPIYYAGKRVVDDNGNVSWEPAKLEPAFVGDDLPQRARPLTTQAIERIKANLVKRGEVHRASMVAQGGELAQFMERLAKAANLAPAAPAAVKGGKANG